MKKRAAIGLALVLAGLAATPAFAGSWVQDPGRAENQNGISNWW